MMRCCGIVSEERWPKREMEEDRDDEVGQLSYDLQPELLSWCQDAWKCLCIAVVHFVQVLLMTVLINLHIRELLESLST